MRGSDTRSVFIAAAAMLTVAAGCTMCPDPHDYAGPVPNGSAPQNDFRARSNGILPVGATAMPWPPQVRDVSRPAGPATPTPAAPVGDDDGQPVVAESDGDVLRLSAEEAVLEEEAVPPESADDTQPDPALEDVPVPAADPEPAADDEPIPEIEPTTEPDAEALPQQEQAAPAPAGPRETPGWRSRR